MGAWRQVRALGVPVGEMTVVCTRTAINGWEMKVKAMVLPKK